MQLASALTVVCRNRGGQRRDVSVETWRPADPAAQQALRGLYMTAGSANALYRAAEARGSPMGWCSRGNLELRAASCQQLLELLRAAAADAAEAEADADAGAALGAFAARFEAQLGSRSLGLDFSQASTIKLRCTLGLVKEEAAIDDVVGLGGVHVDYRLAGTDLEVDARVDAQAKSHKRCILNLADRAYGHEGPDQGQTKLAFPKKQQE